MLDLHALVEHKLFAQSHFSQPLDTIFLAVSDLPSTCCSSRKYALRSTLKRANEAKYYPCQIAHGVQTDLNAFAALPSSDRTRVRKLIIQNLQDGSSPLFNDEGLNDKAFLPMEQVQMHLPMSIGDYTDFFSSYVHAQNVRV